MTQTPPFAKGGVGGILTDHIDIWTAADTEKKSGRGRSVANAGSVYGIKKLRELILELAVRGKLVLQDANDEPASELLKRIQAEKARLIAEGKIKSPRNPPLSKGGGEAGGISEDEQPFDLPRGWAYSRLGDAVEIIRGITFPGSEKSKVPEAGRVACLRTTNVQDQIEWDDLLYIGEEFVSREDQYLMPRDIVMSMANSRELVGKVALVGEVIDQKTSFGGFLGVLRPFLIEPRFVMALLRTPHTREELIDSASQTTNIANISLAKLRPLFFAIPPLAEQHRIVAKVDELMALCDQLESQHSNAAEAHETLVSHLLGTLTKSPPASLPPVAKGGAGGIHGGDSDWQRIAAHFDTLFTTDASIDALKQTLLQLAVMGKLVPQDANDLPASDLLKRIQAEKAKLIAEGKIKSPRNPPFAKGGGEAGGISEDEKPFDLPKGWAWVRLGELVEKSGAGWSPICEGHPRIGNDWGVLKVSAVSWGKFLPDENKALPITLDARLDCVVETGDFLVSRANTAELVARSVVVEDCPPNLMLSDKIVRLRFSSFCDIRFINIANSSSFARSYYSLVAGGTSSSMKNVTREQILNLIVGKPPLAEQHRIVAKVDELMALCDQLKSRIVDARQLQQKLADVLVEQAVARE